MNMKKKAFLTLLMAVGTLAVQADDYAYLTFETTEGAKFSVSVESLALTFSGNTLTAGNQSFTLSNLSKMYFSGSNETTAVEGIDTMTLDEATEIFDLNGRKVSKSAMRKGAYIVKSKSRTYKIMAN